MAQCGGDISSWLGPYPIAACPEFHISCRLGRELFTMLICCWWCPWSHGLWSKRLYHCVTVTPAPARVLTLRSLVPTATSVVGYTENFSPCSHIIFHVESSMHTVWFCLQHLPTQLCLKVVVFWLFSDGCNELVAFLICFSHFLYLNVCHFVNIIIYLIRFSQYSSNSKF